MVVCYVSWTRADEDRADALFHALADRTRRDIMRRVLAGEHSVSTLAANYDMSFAAVQKHVAVLERAGLLTKRRQGREALASGDVERCGRWASMLTELEAALARPHRPDRRAHRPDHPGHSDHRRTEPCPSPTSPTTSTPGP